MIAYQPTTRTGTAPGTTSQNRKRAPQISIRGAALACIILGALLLGAGRATALPVFFSGLLAIIAVFLLLGDYVTKWRNTRGADPEPRPGKAGDFFYGAPPSSAAAAERARRVHIRQLLTRPGLWN